MINKLHIIVQNKGVRHIIPSRFSGLITGTVCTPLSPIRYQVPSPFLFEATYCKSLYVDPVDPNCKVRFLWLRIETVMLGDLGAESDKASPSLVGCRSLWWLLFLNASER